MSEEVSSNAAASTSSAPPQQQQQEIPLDLDEHVALLEKYSSVAELLRARSIVFIADFLVRDAEDLLRLAHISRAHRDTILNHTKDAVFSRIAEARPHVLFAPPPLHWLRDKTQCHVADPALKDILARCQQDASLKGPSEIDKHILLVCKDVLGLKGNRADTWSASNHLAAFAGVKCNESDGRVTKLNHQGCHLQGMIPELLSQLSKLTFLSLGNNLLKGELPSSLSRLADLRYLQLNGNRLSGIIPRSLGQLKNLELLYLSDNFFTDRCPDVIRQLPCLKSGFLLLDEIN